MSTASRAHTLSLVICSAITLSIVFVASCAPTARQRYNRQLAQTGKPAQHAIHSERLEEVMNELDELALARMPQELDPDTERARQSREITKLAAGLADAAQRIPDSVAADELNNQERELFTKLASQLHTQATELELSASKLSPSQLEQRLDRIIATCNACHDQFRMFPPVEN